MQGQNKSKTILNCVVNGTTRSKLWEMANIINPVTPSMDLSGKASHNLGFNHNGQLLGLGPKQNMLAVCH